MIWSICLTLASVAVMALVAPSLARQLPPATATVLLVGSALVTVAGTGYVLGALAFTWLAQFPEVAEQGNWSPLVLRSTNSVPVGVEIVGGVVLMASGLWALRAGGRRARAFGRMRRSLAGLDHDGGVVIVDSPKPDAYATLAGGGRVVITSALLSALRPGECAAVLAHEQAHLRLRHHLWIVVADLAAAANPCLRSTATAVAESVERWADEQAAIALGDRKLVARALARAALHTHTTGSGGRLAVVSGQVPRRVNALLAPPPRRRLIPLALLVFLLAMVGAATLSVEKHADYIFDRATISTR
jgi:hypothetical protein